MNWYTAGILIALSILFYKNIHSEPDDQLTLLGVVTFSLLWPVVVVAVVVVMLLDERL